MEINLPCPAPTVQYPLLPARRLVLHNSHQTLRPTHRHTHRYTGLFDRPLDDQLYVRPAPGGLYRESPRVGLWLHVIPLYALLIVTRWREGHFRAARNMNRYLNSLEGHWQFVLLQEVNQRTLKPLGHRGVPRRDDNLHLMPRSSLSADKLGHDERYREAGARTTRNDDTSVVGGERTAADAPVRTLEEDGDAEVRDLRRGAGEAAGHAPSGRNVEYERVLLRFPRWRRNTADGERVGCEGVDVGREEADEHVLGGTPVELARRYRDLHHAAC